MKIKTIQIQESDKIEELKFELNTQETGVSTFITPLINGELDCIIVDADQPVNMMITFEEESSIVLFDTKNNYIQGQKYLPLRYGALSEDYENRNFAPVKWSLNNKLRFEITGPRNTIVKIKIRYC